MEIEIAFEIRVFFLCGLCGVACGIVYDLFRIARRCLKAGAAATFVLDMFFWIVCAFLSFGMVFYANYGRLRWYEIFGAVLGCAVYFISASGLVVGGGVRVVNGILKLLGGLIKILFAPVIFILRLFFKPLCKLFEKISKKIKKNRLTMGRFWFKIKKRLDFYTKILRK